ncbi:Uncharacterised protein [uncultured archaeon]|nr:Uncharacterised protein [uncultured archaeon]
METKKSSTNLEVKLESLKYELTNSLKATRLITDPAINGLTLTYKRRGQENKDQCRIIQKGLKIMLQNAYRGYVDLSFETVDEMQRIYRVKLEVLAEKKEEQETTYNALTKINEFINFYNKSRK